MRKLPLLISIGLLAACGETNPTPASDADGGAESNTAQPAVVQTATVAASTAAAPSIDASVAQKAASLSVLPLKRGYYVASDTPCGSASNATLSLLRRDGIGGVRDFCEFVKIEKTGADTYNVTEKCVDLQAGPESAETSKVVWTIAKDTGFSRKSSNGWESSARYCVQSSLPDDWRDTDISDVVN